MKTVVVLGSNSFSGGDFVDLLLEDGRYRVVGISRSAEQSRVVLAYRDRADLSRFSFLQLDLNRDSDALLELLETLFSAEECRVAAAIPLRLAKLGQIARAAKLPAPAFSEIQG